MVESDFGALVDSAVARNMKSARERAGMSQSELASLLSKAGLAGMHQTTIARIENGQRALRLAEALAIARLLDYQVEDLAESTAASTLRWEYDALRKAFNDFMAAAEELFRVRLSTAQALDARFPYAGDGTLGGEVLSVRPNIFNLISQLLTTNSSPLFGVMDMYDVHWRNLRDSVEPFKSSWQMDILDELVTQGYGGLKIHDRTSDSDEAFERAVGALLSDAGRDDG